MPLNSAPEKTAAEVEREVLILECLTLVYGAYERDLPAIGSVHLNVKISAWKMSLADVPSGELKRIVMAEIQNRTSEFLPVPADLIRRWKGDTNEPAVANAAAYAPLQPTPAELKARALPSGDQETFRAAWNELGEKLRGDKKRGYATEPIARQTPANALQLSRAMREWLNMATWQIAAELRDDFGYWLLGRFPVTEWTPQLGEEQWNIYHLTVAVAS